MNVYSGISPPRELLDAVAASNGKSIASPSDTDRGPPPPSRPSDRPTPGCYTGNAPAPPSYEDAIADTLGPLDGQRHEYNSSLGGGVPAGTRDDQKHADGSSRQSLESIHSASTGSTDIPPSSPSDHDPESPAHTPVEELSDMRKVHPDVRPPSYQQRISSEQHHVANLGVPHRKPLPSHSTKSVD